MVRVRIFLLLLFVLQCITAGLAIRLVPKTKYNLAWFLITFGFIIMAGGTLTEFLCSEVDSPESRKIFLEVSFWVNGVSAVLLLLGILLIKRIFIYIQTTEKERKKNDKKLLTTIIQTEEGERMRLSKELHDGLGPLLSTIKLSISSLSRIEQNPKALEILETTHQIVQDSLKTVKDISNNLNPHILTNFGLEKAVENFANRLNNNSLLQISIHSNIGNRRFDSNTEIILYRVICELINNTLKHASASHVVINLSCTSEKIHVIYTDDGIGFNIDEAMKNPKGIGLSNMRSRLDSLNGSIDIQSDKDDGMIANIEIPIKFLEL